MAAEAASSPSPPLPTRPTRQRRYLASWAWAPVLLALSAWWLPSDMTANGVFDLSFKSLIVYSVLLPGAVWWAAQGRLFLLRVPLVYLAVTWLWGVAVYWTLAPESDWGQKGLHVGIAAAYAFAVLALRPRNNADAPEPSQA